METLDCPRCGLPLSPDKYEKVPVDVCRECWGYWLDVGEFAQIATSHDFMFNESERKQVLDFAKKRQSATEAKTQDEPLACPKCKKVMEKVKFDLQAPITLDRCEAHGMWMDTHELKLAQVLAEDAATVRQIFFQKLRE